MSNLYQPPLQVSTLQTLQLQQQQHPMTSRGPPQTARGPRQAPSSIWTQT